MISIKLFSERSQESLKNKHYSFIAFTVLLAVTKTSDSPTGQANTS